MRPVTGPPAQGIGNRGREKPRKNIVRLLNFFRLLLWTLRSGYTGKSPVCRATRIDSTVGRHQTTLRLKRTDRSNRSGLC